MCNVLNEKALTCAKFGADLINTSKVTSGKTKRPRFLCHPVGRRISDVGRVVTSLLVVIAFLI